MAKTFAQQNVALGPYIHQGMTAINTVDASAAGLNSAALSAGMTMLMDWDFDVDMEEITLVYPAAQFDDMAAEVRFASMDYMQGTNAPGVAKTGRFEEIYGMKPIFIGQKGRRDLHNGALPANRAYAFCKSAVGLSIGVTERMGIIEEIPQKRSWMIGAECNSGAVVKQLAGIVEFTLA